MSVIHNITRGLCTLFTRGQSQHSDSLNDHFAAIVYSYRLNFNFKQSFYNCLLPIMKGNRQITMGK